MNKLRPLNNRIIVKRLESDKETNSGIIIIDSEDPPAQGTVIYAGNGIKMENGELRPLHVKVGDSIIYGKSCGQICKVGRDELFIMTEDDVLAIIDK